MVFALAFHPARCRLCLTSTIGGERIAELGVGPNPIRYKELTAKRLQEAMRFGVGNSQTKQKAAELGQKIRTENGIENALSVFETR